MTIISDLMETIGTILTSFVSLMSDAFEGVVAIIYVADTGFTTVGYLFILGLAIGVFYFAFRFVRYLISLRGSR